MDITKLFKSKTRKALFRHYFTNPDAEHFLREMERLFDIPVSMLRKELTALEKEGIFVSKQRGKNLYYSLNKSYPLFEELKSIVFKTIGVQGLLENRIKRIKNIDTAFIYGSYAKNQESITSDIDLFITGDIDEDKLVSEIGRIEKELKREINYSLYSKDDFQKKKKKKDPFIMDVIKNPKIFLIGNEDDL